MSHADATLPRSPDYANGSVRYKIGGQLGIPASTVHAVLMRCRDNQLSRIDRVTGGP